MAANDRGPRGRRRDRRAAAGKGTALRSLTLAAIALPGVLSQPADAIEGEGVDVQYGSYREGARDIVGVKSKHDPIRVESLRDRVRFTIDDRLRGELNYSQDTWSGATPVATAPRVAEGNRASAPDGFSGASPYLYGNMQLDAQRRPLRRDAAGNLLGPDTRLAHTLAGASPETRKQVDLSFSRQFDTLELETGIGLSREDDYESRFGTLGLRRDFNQQLTTLSAGISYTNSSTNAELDHDASPYVYGYYDLKGNPIYNERNDSSHIRHGQFAPTLHGKREDWSGRIGVAQVLDANSLLEASVGYTRSSGYLGNPYKAVQVGFIDPTQQWGTAGGNSAADYAYDVALVALPERRPDRRNQGTFGLRYVRHLEVSDSALHLHYRYFRDDWGIRAHTMEVAWAKSLGRGWRVTPRLRYYSQGAAGFHAPYLLSEQGLFSYTTDPVNGPIFVNASTPNDGHRYHEDQSGSVAPAIDENPASWNYGNPVVLWNGGAVIDESSGEVVGDQSLVDSLMQDTTYFDPRKLPAHYASDPRLSAYGTLAAGITIAKQFASGLRLEFGWERMRHAGSLRLGGGGEGAYADFDSSMFNVVLTADLDATGLFAAPAHAGADAGGHAHHAGHAARAPAGVMFDHLLRRPGEFMVSYRYQYAHRAGELRHGSSAPGDAAVVGHGCGPDPCFVRPLAMSMHMHMLDIMYAVSDRLNLMLMPQLVDMNMSMRQLEGAPSTGGMGDPLAAAVMHAGHRHESGEIGDTELHALFGLAGNERWRLLLGIGLSAPTGDAGLQMRDVMQQDMGYMDYGMQAGSGTWDLKPSLSYSAAQGHWRWGAQLGGTKRLEGRNRHGYALGDVFQASGWAERDLVRGVSASLRLVHARQGEIDGGFDSRLIRVGPADHAGNYGGNSWDLGLGLNLELPGAARALGGIGLEYLQPLAEQPNGYQLERKGALSVRWDLRF